MRRGAFLLLVGLGVCTARAQPATANETSPATVGPLGDEGPLLSLEQATAQAKERNLDLQAARAKLMQAKQTAAKVWANLLPQISAAGSYTRNNVEAAIGLPTGYYVRSVLPPGAPAPCAPGQSPPGCTPIDLTQVSGPYNWQPPINGVPGFYPSPYVMVPNAFQTVTIQKLNQWGAQGQVTLPLFVPALWPAIRNAYTIQEVAELNVDNAQREVLFALAQLYYGAVGLKRTTEVQKRQLDLSLRHEADARVRFEAGTVPKSALLRAEIDRSRAEQDFKRSVNAYASTKSALATMLDRSPDFSVDIPPEPKLPADLQALEQAALQNRPDVLGSRKQVTIAERQRASSWLKYLPNLALTGQYRIANVTGFTGRYDAWAVIAGLNWTLFDGGAREAELRENGWKIVEAEATRRSTEAKARDEVVRARYDLDSAIANRAKAAEQLKLARENIQLVNVSYESGAATYLEVEDAKAALLGAEIGAIAESLNLGIAALKLLKAAGEFNP